MFCIEPKKIREKIACPQFGDRHYGEWGALRFEQRLCIFRLLQLVEAQEKRLRELEEKHGTWEEHDYIDDVVYTCSVCGEDWVTLEGTPADNLWNYCPHCGARMDGETK